MNKILRLLDAPIPRHWYAIGVIVCVDVPASLCVRNRAWLYVAIYLGLMIWATARRFHDAGLGGWLAAPYSFIAFSPFSILYFRADTSLLLVVLAVVVLQIPAMIYKRQQGEAAANPHEI